jgi:succinate dehydrogenase / fumarate reductase, cytochrome b subunit
VSEASGSSPKPPQNFFDKHHFLLRRLHSLSGIVPVGMFVIMHLFTNFQILVGNFQHEVEFIHSMPALLAIEITLWLSIGFHAALGFYYTFTGRVNNRTYNYGGNWRYTLQRVTGIIALIFIFLHIATLRWGWSFAGMIDTPFFVKGPNDIPLVSVSTAIALQHSKAIALIYIIGVFSVVYHWSNGLWTAAITWGLTVSDQAQRRWGVVCIGLFVALSVFSAGAIYGSLVYKVTPAQWAAYKYMKENAGKPGFDVHNPDKQIVIIEENVQNIEVNPPKGPSK